MFSFNFHQEKRENLFQFFSSQQLFYEKKDECSLNVIKLSDNPHIVSEYLFSYFITK